MPSAWEPHWSIWDGGGIVSQRQRWCFFPQGKGKKVAEQQTSPQTAKGKGETHTQSVADGLVLVHRPRVLVSDQRRRESERKLSETLTAISHCCGI